MCFHIGIAYPKAIFLVTKTVVERCWKMLKQPRILIHWVILCLIHSPDPCCFQGSLKELYLDSLPGPLTWPNLCVSNARKKCSIGSLSEPQKVTFLEIWRYRMINPGRTSGVVRLPDTYSHISIAIIWRDLIDRNSFTRHSLTHYFDYKYEYTEYKDTFIVFKVSLIEFVN